jgi:uridine kinase
MILLIDGRSGSGKTELAKLLGAPLLRMDDIYPGWGGLRAASEMLPEILRTRRWRRYDWATQSLAEWNELGDGTLVVEGCGALSRASRELADFGLWVEHPAASRKLRALAREPDFDSHWDAWAAQEDAFIEREHPRDLADAIIDGADVSLVVGEWRAKLGA